MGKTSRAPAGMSSISWQHTPVVQPKTPLRDPVYVVSPCEASSHICLVMRQNRTERTFSKCADVCTYARATCSAWSITH